MDLPAIAFIGAGNMGSAIIAGLQRRDQVPPITVCDQSADIRQRHAETCHTVTDDLSVAAHCAVLVLAVKPQVAAQVMADLAPHLGADQLIISIMAGIPAEQMEAALPDGIAVIRAMPNTPMAIGRGMIGIAPGAAATSSHLDIAETIFSSAGAVLRIEESQMNALTAVSGSGPAYVFAFAEAWLHAAKTLGFNDEQATMLVRETLVGSTEYLHSQAGFPAAQLREQVTSPGGTTAAALAVLTENHFPALVTDALTAARDRGVELAG